MKRYKMFNGDEYIGTYTTVEIYQLYKIESKTVYLCAYNDNDYNGYYFELEEDVSDLLPEWDKTRKTISNAPDQFVKVIIRKPFWKNEKPRIEKVQLNIDK